ncbi:MAG: hypothetical protein GW778_04275 [Alphaproteobacteria bacterium]|nr:hypothetical protein [Alphaproteobacteria bacterium]
MRLFILSLFMLFFTAPYAHAQMSCLNADVKEEVARLMQQSTPDSARAKATKQVEIGIAKGIVKPEKKRELVEVVVEYSTRKNAKCAIPNQLKARVSNSLSLIQGDWKYCAEEGFDIIIDRQFDALKASNGYEIFEGVIKQQISSNVIPDARAKFIERWDANPGFRERVIKTGLELNVMYTNKCSNIPDPIMDIIAEF